MKEVEGEIITVIVVIVVILDYEMAERLLLGFLIGIHLFISSVDRHLMKLHFSFDYLDARSNSNQRFSRLQAPRWRISFPGINVARRAV